MKKLYKTILAVALLFGAMSLNAQNVCTIGKGTGHSLTFESSNKIVYEQKSDNVVLGHSVMEYQNPVMGKTDTYSITVCPQGDWNNLTVVSANTPLTEGGYYKFVTSNNNPEGVVDDVEAGTYEVYVCGGHGKHDWFYSTYLINVDHNLEFHPTADADAVHEISIVGVDENNETLANKDIKLMYYDALFHYSAGDDMIFLLCGDSYADRLVGFRFNDLTEKDRISIYAPIYTEGQKNYFVEYPAVLGGSNNLGWTVSNTADDMRIHEEYYDVPDNSDPYYYLNYIEYVHGQMYLDNVGYMTAYGFDDNLHYNPNEPLTFVTNISSRGEEFEEGEAKAKICPGVFLYPPKEDGSEVKIVSSSMYYTDEGELIREPFDVFLSTVFYSHGNTPHYFEPSPISNFYKEKETVRFGERTPISYYQSLNYSEEGYAYCSGGLLFLGENGTQRYGDEFSNVKVKIDGEEVFDDILLEYNMMTGYFDSDIPFAVNVEITNEQLVCDNVVKSNKTIMDFDLNREDAMPPTLTFMQVLDENNEESICLPDYSNSSINFSAGDFTGYADDLWGITHVTYFAKPLVEVYYSTESKDWTAFDYTEVEDMFHVNYGNYFTIELSQLDESVLNHWVNLKFVVTDEAGNSQVQELSNVFYVGQQTSVNEATTLTHTVYPTPFTHEVRINAAEAVNGNASINVFNVLGEQVISKVMNCSETTEFVIDGSSLNAGIYFYSIATENGTLQGRIVKE